MLRSVLNLNLPESIKMETHEYYKYMKNFNQTISVITLTFLGVFIVKNRIQNKKMKDARPKVTSLRSSQRSQRSLNDENREKADIYTIGDKDIQSETRKKYEMKTDPEPSTSNQGNIFLEL